MARGHEAHAVAGHPMIRKLNSSLLKNCVSRWDAEHASFFGATPVWVSLWETSWGFWLPATSWTIETMPYAMSGWLWKTRTASRLSVFQAFVS